MTETSATNPFEESAKDYDRWYDQHAAAFAAEIAVLRAGLGGSFGRGLEIGIGTGRFAAALGLSFGVDPSRPMLRLAERRGVATCQGLGEQLPFASEIFDVVLLVTVLCFVRDRQRVLLEARRVLKDEGRLVIGFIDRVSPLGRRYQAAKDYSRFHRQATFLSGAEMTDLLRRTGFAPTCWRQTLFEGSPEDATRVKEGMGEGGFVALAARKAAGNS